MKYGVIVGRWPTVWAFVWYADVVIEGSDTPYVTFNALSKRGALRKAARFIRRQNVSSKETYVYDESINKLEKINV